MKDPKNILILVLLAGAAFLLGHTIREDTAHGQGYPGGSTDSNGRMIAVTGTIPSRIPRRKGVRRCDMSRYSYADRTWGPADRQSSSLFLCIVKKTLVSFKQR